MENLRSRFTSLIDEVAEDQVRSRETIMRVESDKLQALAKLAKVEAENIVLRGQLSALHQDITDEQYFEIATADDLEA
jgi:hypothetical protein